MSDPYFEMALEQRDNILKLYDIFEDKDPIMLFDICEKRIYAYPYEEFKSQLSDSSQIILEGQYERALAGNCMVVFVRDNENEKLVCYSM